MSHAPRGRDYPTDSGPPAGRGRPARASRWWFVVQVSISGLLAALVAACSPQARYPEPAHPDEVVPDEVPFAVSPEQAARFIGHPGVSFIDARPRKLYLKGHVPGAVHADWTEFRDESATLMTGKLDADLDRLAALFATKGIARDTWAIVVGDPISLWGEEGRIAWTLEYLGARRVSIVDGGWTAWMAADLPTQRGEVSREPAEFAASVVDKYMARKQDVEAFMHDRENWQTVLVDVREPGEFRGAPDAPLYGALRGGHVPGAVNLPWRSLLGPDGKVLPPAELESILIDKGIRPDARIVTYCTGGVRSAHTWFVLRGLGYPVVKNYAASWWEWSLDRKLPAETGGQRDMPLGPAWPPVEEPSPENAEEPSPAAAEEPSPAAEPAPD